MSLHPHFRPGDIAPIFPLRCFLVNCCARMDRTTMYFAHQDYQLRAGEAARGKARLQDGCPEQHLP